MTTRLRNWKSTKEVDKIMWKWDTFFSFQDDQLENVRNQMNREEESASIEEDVVNSPTGLN